MSLLGIHPSKRKIIERELCQLVGNVAPPTLHPTWDCVGGVIACRLPLQN